MERYGPYESGQGYLFYIDVDGAARKSVWVHREVMEKALGRGLSPSETVHHVDGDKKNNLISNLQVMGREEHASYHAPQAKKMEITCQECGVVVSKLCSQVKHNQVNMGRAGPFCGRSCAGRFNQRKRMPA